MPTKVNENEKVRVSLDLSPSAFEILEQISAEEQITKNELLRRAIALMKVAADAKKQGHSLGLLDAKGKIVVQIIGV